MRKPVKKKNKPVPAEITENEMLPDIGDTAFKPSQELVVTPAKTGAPHKKKNKVSMLDVRRMERLERRRLLTSYRMKGFTLDEIATQMNLTSLQVARELEAMRDENATRIKDFDRTNAVISCVSVFEQIEVECWKNYRAAVMLRDKNAILNTLRAARNDQIKLLEDLGFLSKAPTQVNHNIEAKAALQDMTDKTQQLLAMAFMRAQLKPLPEPEIDTNLPILETTFTTSVEQGLPQHSTEQLKELFGDLSVPEAFSDEEIFGEN